MDSSGSSNNITRSLLPVIYPDLQGGYNPQFSCDTPNHLKFKGGVYVIVMEGVINNNKMLIHKIWSFYSQEYC